MEYFGMKKKKEMQFLGTYRSRMIILHTISSILVRNSIFLLIFCELLGKISE